MIVTIPSYQCVLVGLMQMCQNLQPPASRPRHTPVPPQCRLERAFDTTSSLVATSGCPNFAKRYSVMDKMVFGRQRYSIFIYGMSLAEQQLRMSECTWMKVRTFKVVQRGLGSRQQQNRSPGSSNRHLTVRTISTTEFCGFFPKQRNATTCQQRSITFRRSSAV